MSKKKWTKIVAFIALLWIIIWIVGTWLLIIFGNNYEAPSPELSPEQLQKLIESETK
jgi:hypothetical protein